MSKLTLNATARELLGPLADEVAIAIAEIAAQPLTPYQMKHLRTLARIFGNTPEEEEEP